MKIRDFSETIAASDLKASKSRHQIHIYEDMRVLKVKVIS